MERRGEEVGRARVGRQRGKEKYRGAEVTYLFHVSVDSYLEPHTAAILCVRRGEEGRGEGGRKGVRGGRGGREERERRRERG